MLSLYFDDDSGEIAVLRGLKRAGVDALRSIEAGTEGWSDEDHLQYATASGRILVTSNRGDFLALHGQWIRAERDHAGIVIGEQWLGIGERIRRLEHLVRNVDHDQMRNRIEFLGAWGPGEE